MQLFFSDLSAVSAYYGTKGNLLDILNIRVNQTVSAFLSQTTELSLLENTFATAKIPQQVTLSKPYL